MSHISQIYKNTRASTKKRQTHKQLPVAIEKEILSYTDDECSFITQDGNRCKNSFKYTN